MAETLRKDTDRGQYISGESKRGRGQRPLLHKAEENLLHSRDGDGDSTQKMLVEWRAWFERTERGNSLPDSQRDSRQAHRKTRRAAQSRPKAFRHREWPNEAEKHALDAL